jgi:biopolymer transport protein ExbD
MHGSGGGSGPYKKARIEIIPLIDVMFFLLASFIMVSLSMQKLQVLKMDLPTAVPPKSSTKPDVFEIEILRDVTYRVDKKLYSLPEMERELDKRYAANTNLPVYIKADQNVTHGVVMNILDTVKAHKISKVSFAIEAPKE